MLQAGLTAVNTANNSFDKCLTAYSRLVSSSLPTLMGRNKGSTSAGMDLIPGGLKASKQSYTLVPAGMPRIAQLQRLRLHGNPLTTGSWWLQFEMCSQHV
jgi:hypothetical protein